MKILVTGFKPFLNEAINPSKKLASELSNKFSFVESLILPVEFQKSFELLKMKISAFNPDYLILFGQAAGRGNVCLEKIGLNWAQTENADEAGFAPKTGKILPDKELAVMTRFPIDSVFLQLKKSGFPVEISFSAGTYVCNDLYFRTLNEFRNIFSIFIHVPLLPEQLKQQDSRPSIGFERQLEVAVETISYLEKNYSR